MMEIPDTISAHDRTMLRELAARQAEIASQPEQEATAEKWRRLNELQAGRPLVWLNDIPWEEMNVDDALTLQTETEWCRQVESALRQTLYQWDHLRGDMVVDAVFYSPKIIEDSGFGITEKLDMNFREDGEEYAHWQYHGQIETEADLDRINVPTVTYLGEPSLAQFERLTDLFGDLLSVELRGIPHAWFSPWEQLGRWWNMEQAILDLSWRPDLVHGAMERLVNAHLGRLQQWDSLGLLSTCPGNYPVGTGGPGFHEQLRTGAETPAHPGDQWGCASASIFALVSPLMHEEFALDFEREWLEQFAWTYYGSDEPLHNKLSILESVPNLRKVSISPYADIATASWQMAGRYVMSLKPDPAVLAEDEWDREAARRDLESRLMLAEGCVVELVMGDIVTVRGAPRRLWEWVAMAMEAVHNRRLVGV